MNIEGSVNQGHFEKNVWVVTFSVEYYGQRFEQSVENTFNISKKNDKLWSFTPPFKYSKFE